MKVKAVKIILGAGVVLSVAVILIFGSKVFGPRIQAPEKFGFGRLVSTQEIEKWDTEVRPDGKGLPAGNGSIVQGKAIYAVKCAACHAADGKEIPGVKLPGPPLVSDTIAKGKSKTIGNYWPYATTLFDYVRRTMPYNAPGSLTDTEVYDLTAFLLHANHIIKDNEIMNAQTLPKVIMPARKLFIRDVRHGGKEVR